MPKIKVVYM